MKNGSNCLIIRKMALQQSLKSGRLIPPVSFFFLKIALAIQGFLYFHTNCEIICSRSVKNTAGSLIGIALNLQIALGSMLIFTILILPIHEHGIFPPSISVLFDFFHQCFIVFYIQENYSFLQFLQVDIFLTILFFSLQW